MDEVKLLTGILKKYVGIKLYKEDQDVFKKEFFDSLFEPYAPVDYSTRTTLLINTILEEDNLPYVFSSEEEVDDNSGRKGEVFWILIDLNKI